MLQIGIRLHDVNAHGTDEERTLEARAKKAKEEGFSCVHLAVQKVIDGLSFDEGGLTEGLGFHLKRVFARNDLDIAVLGCYLNLAHPDPDERRRIKSVYNANLRLARVAGAGVVGTETGAPNAQYKLDAETHTEHALCDFMRSLEDVLDSAERWGVALAIEPVYNHIVYTPKVAQRVIREMGSRNLRVILDPVNLLCAENAESADAIFAEAIDLLGEKVAVLHLKDYTLKDGRLLSCAAGTGVMDYSRLMAFARQKPCLQATLEDTTDANAVQALKAIQRAYEA